MGRGLVVLVVLAACGGGPDPTDPVDPATEAQELYGLSVGARWTYLKWTPRAQEDKALVGVAAVLVVDGRHCRLARLGLGGVNPSPVVLRAAERELEGAELDAAAIARAADAAAAEVDPIDDLQASADYRRQMVRLWIRRVVSGLVAAEPPASTEAVGPVPPLAADAGDAKGMA